MECGDNGVSGQTVLRNAFKVFRQEIECATIQQQLLEADPALELVPIQQYVHPVSMS